MEYLECEHWNAFPLQKLYVFLFQEVLVLTRPVTRNERQAFQVYRQPIPVHELLLEDLQDGDVKMGGSFRGAFGNSDKGTEPLGFVHSRVRKRLPAAFRDLRGFCWDFKPPNGICQ